MKNNLSQTPIPGSPADKARFKRLQRRRYNEPAEPDYDGYYDDYNDDYNESSLSYSQQVWQDRSDYAREMLAAGHIDEVQAMEISMGA
jgi:hypothetical protein